MHFIMVLDVIALVRDTVSLLPGDVGGQRIHGVHSTFISRFVEHHFALCDLRLVLGHSKNRPSTLSATELVIVLAGSTSSASSL